MRGFRTGLVAAAVIASCVGCGGSSATGGTKFSLYTHCGINELKYDGKWYVRDGGVLDDGSGNPPKGWGDPEQDGRLVVDSHRATFTDDQGHRETFTERVGATTPLNVCS